MEEKHKMNDEDKEKKFHDLYWLGQKPLTKKAIIEAFFSDERIMLQSEELYEHFSDEEKDILKKAYAGNIIYEICKKSAPYLVNTGYIEEQQGKAIIILPCLIEYLQQTSKVTTIESTLTKKEKKLFDLLYENKNKICERDLIIHNVWPECNEIGVSDWAIDRLVSRLRQKLKHAKPTTEIKAIKTRGFILEE